MSRTLFSARAARLSLWLGGVALALGIFVRITRELIEGDVGAVDSAILLAAARMRTPWLTSRGRGCDSAGIDHLGGTVLRVHSLGVTCVARPDGRPPVARGFGGSRRIDNRDERPHRKNSSTGGPTVDRSVGLLLPERTFGFDLCALLDDRDHRRRLCATLGRKSRNFPGRVGGADHGWRLTRVPWRPLCD